MTYDEIIEQLEITKSKIKRDRPERIWWRVMERRPGCADRSSGHRRRLQQSNSSGIRDEPEVRTASNGGQTCSRALYLPALRQENTGRPHALSLVRKEALLGQRSIRRPRLPTYEHEGRQETMIIQLEIPKEFAKDYANNRFDDFFRRVYADIDNEGMCGNYEGETAQMMARAFKESRCLDYEKTR